MSVILENSSDKRMSLNGDISLIQEEDSREITTLYDNEQAVDTEKEVMRYSLMFDDNGNNASTVNSPMQLKLFDNFKLSYDDINKNGINNYSRTTSANSQFSENRKTSTSSSTRNSYSSYNYETVENDSNKPLQLPKLRSPFKSKENSTEIDINVVNAKPLQKKRNRSLRWSYQGQIDTINEVQKQKAISETENKLFANENVTTKETDTSSDDQVYLKPIHKRTTSLPYASSLKVDTSSSDASSSNMISLKRRLSPSTFFKSGSEDREGKIKQQQKKIKELEMENLKQFSQIQELISQTSYCVKEIELLKQTSMPKSQSKIFSFKNTLYFLVLSVLLSMFIYEIATDSSSIFNTESSVKHTYTIPNLDFPGESLWYSSKNEQTSTLLNLLLNKAKQFYNSYISSPQTSLG